jgi:hypothetical protein
MYRKARIIKKRLAKPAIPVIARQGQSRGESRHGYPKTGGTESIDAHQTGLRRRGIYKFQGNGM